LEAERKIIDRANANETRQKGDKQTHFLFFVRPQTGCK
jgi:hypothetical protein